MKFMFCTCNYILVSIANHVDFNIKLDWRDVFGSVLVWHCLPPLLQIKDEVKLDAIPVLMLKFDSVLHVMWSFFIPLIFEGYGLFF